MKLMTNRLLDVWESLLSFSKYVLSKAFSQNVKYCSVAFSLLFSIYVHVCGLFRLLCALTSFSKSKKKRIYCSFCVSG